MQILEWNGKWYKDELKENNIDVEEFETSEFVDYCKDINWKTEHFNAASDIKKEFYAIKTNDFDNLKREFNRLHNCSKYGNIVLAKKVICAGL